jgi:Taurine catabolism dioxygenase TauD, TfdA family
MAIDIEYLAARCAVVPQRSADPAEVRALLEHDGAAILTGLDTGVDSAGHLAALVLGDRLRASGHPIEVTDGGGKDRRLTADAARRMLPLHTDGFAYGAQAPDVFFLLCATPSVDDGLSFLIDQKELLDALAETPTGAELADFARNHVVDQSEPGGVPTLGPLALPLLSGTSTVRRSPFVRPTDDDPDPARTARLLTLWQGILDAVGALAQRFPVGAGDAVAIDNTRLAHGRDAYTTAGRLLWRCWAWTDRAGGFPEGELWSDTRMVLAAE